MHSLNPLHLAPDQAELSRHAAERFAIMTALTEQRTLNRRPPRPWRLVRKARHALAISTVFRRRRLS